MVTENTAQPLEELTKAGPGPGAPDGEPQPAPVEDDAPKGAETQKRTYSQAEFDKHKSALDKQVAGKEEMISELRQALADTTRQSAVAQERFARERDRLALDNGEITSSDLFQRQADREKEQEDAVQTKETQSSQAQEAAMLQQAGKVMAALSIGKEAGIDPNLLIDDATLNDVPMMELRARELRLEQAEADKPGQESFDSGRGTAATAGSSSYVQKLKSGEVLPAAAEIDRLTAKYLT